VARLFCFQLLNTVDDHCNLPDEKDGALCLSDVKALHMMQRELREKEVDVKLFLALGFKQLSGDSAATPSYPGKLQGNVLCSFPTDYTQITPDTSNETVT
jgi:hypothetical protein